MHKNTQAESGQKKSKDFVVNTIKKQKITITANYKKATASATMATTAAAACNLSQTISDEWIFRMQKT